MTRILSKYALSSLEKKVLKSGVRGARETIEILDSQKELLSKANILSATEATFLSKTISDADRALNTIRDTFLNKISILDKIQNQFLEFLKDRADEDGKIPDTGKSSVDFIRWAEKELNKKILSAKRQDTKINRQREKSELIRFYRKNQSMIKNLYEFMNHIVDAKKQILKKMEQT